MTELTPQNLNQFTPLEIADYLTTNYSYTLPKKANTKEDFDKIGDLLLELAGAYSYVLTLYMYAKASIHTFERSGDKIGKEDAKDRKDVLDNYVKILKMQYGSVSRMISARQQAMEEFKISGEMR